MNKGKPLDGVPPCGAAAPKRLPFVKGEPFGKCYIIENSINQTLVVQSVIYSQKIIGKIENIKSDEQRETFGRCASMWRGSAQKAPLGYKGSWRRSRLRGWSHKMCIRDRRHGAGNPRAGDRPGARRAAARPPRQFAKRRRCPARLARAVSGRHARNADVYKRQV